NGIPYLDRKKLTTNMILEMDLKEWKFTFKDHIFEINQFKFGFEGYMKFLEHAYEMDLKLNVDQTDFKNFLSIIPGFHLQDLKNIDADGEFSLIAQCKGVYDFSANRIPSFNVDLKVKNGRYKYAHLPKAMDNINLEAVFTNNTGNSDNTTI